MVREKLMGTVYPILLWLCYALVLLLIISIVINGYKNRNGVLKKKR
jgi:hypothetical protein